MMLRVVFLALFASSCTALNSTYYSNDYEGGGINYTLPKGEVELQVYVLKADKTVGAIRVNGTSYVPDSDYEYAAQPSFSPFSHDDVEITLEKEKDTDRPTGLLSKVEFTTDEKSDEFILKLIETAKEVAKISEFIPAANYESYTPDKLQLVYTGSFDPLSSSSRFRMNVLLKRFNTDISIHLEARDRQRYEDKLALASSCKSSICFRKPISIPIIFKSNGIEFLRTSVLLPDKSVIGGIDVTRAAMVKKVTSIDFKEGMLASVNVDKPSQALAAAEIPLSIAKAILSVPGEILQLKIDTTKDKTALYQAQLNELKAREALVEYREELANKEDSNENNDIP